MRGQKFIIFELYHRPTDVDFSTMVEDYMGVYYLPCWLPVTARPLSCIASITGHTIRSVETIIERYLIRTGAMARAAFRKRLEQEGE